MFPCPLPHADTKVPWPNSGAQIKDLETAHIQLKRLYFMGP